MPRGLREMLRPVGKPAGSYVAGQLVECKNAIQLCPLCKNKFNAKTSKYIPATRWGRVVGPCDGCREVGRDLILFIHEAFVANTGGRIMNGHVYSPR